MKEVYRPTSDERLRLEMKPDQFKVSGDQVFSTLQGEGITAGAPSVFLRLHFCNLTCGFKEGWQCDTWYTWDRTKAEFWQEPQDWSYEDTASLVKRAWDEKFDDGKKRLVITGGEPLLQQRRIVKLLELLPGWKIEIETNGTIKPLPELENCQFNCSPKLENSGNSARRRYKPDVLKAINKLTKSQFKFVVVSSLDFEEIDHIVEECNLNPEKILIMPEGQTAEEVDIHAEAVRDKVIKRGWKITLRNQLIWFGSRRRT